MTEIVRIRFTLALKPWRRHHSRSKTGIMVYSHWLTPGPGTDIMQNISQLLDFFPFAFFLMQSLYFPTNWCHFEYRQQLKIAKVTKNQLQLITRLHFMSWKRGLKPILEFPSLELGPGPGVVSKCSSMILYTPNFPVPVSGPDPGVSQWIHY